MEEQPSTPVLHQDAHDISPSLISRNIVSIASLMISGAALLDAAIETSFLSRAAIALRASVALLVLLFFVLLGALWSRTRWVTKAVTSALFFLVLTGIAAWLPGGLDNGLMIARQPTSSVLEAISGLAVLTACISFLRLHIPLWLRLVGVAIAAYGFAAFTLALISRQPFAALFHGHSFWDRAPSWSQGALVGVALIPLVIVANVVTALLSRRHVTPARWHWQVDISLALAVLICAAAFVLHPSSVMTGQGGSRSLSGGDGSRSIVDLVHHMVSGAEMSDFDLVLDENGGTIESIGGTANPPDRPFYGPGVDGRRLIDGKMEPVWVGDDGISGLSVRPGIPFDIVFSFYQRQSALVGAVVIFAGKEPTRVPKDVEIWLSSTSPTDGFQKVASGAWPDGATEQRLTFPPIEARYVKVNVLSNHGATDHWSPLIEIAEIRVLEAQSKGYITIRDRNPDLPNWKGSPRYAAQRGIEWLQPATINWQNAKNCFGCHIQAQAIMGLSIAEKNDYVVNAPAVQVLSKFTESHQEQDGSYLRPDEGSTTFAAMGLAYWDDLQAIQKNPVLLKSVDFLLRKQSATGEMPNGGLGCWAGASGGVVNEGSMMATADSLVAFNRAFSETQNPKYKDASDRALAWIESTENAESTPNARLATQDEAFKILALTKFGGPQQKAVVQQMVEQLVVEQSPDGGWPQCPVPIGGGPAGSNPFATGQVLYAFKQAGVSINSSPFIKGVKYLLAKQKEDGSWAASSSEMSTQGAPYAPSMWAIIGLAGSFGRITTGGLQIVAETDPVKAAAARNLEIILDVSGSMNSKLGNSTRIGTARDVLRDLLAKIPDDFNVGLRVYAHRYSWKDKQHSCTDTELLVPIQKLDRQRILSTVANLKPRGDTPLVYSVWQTPADLKPVGGGSVIVITDGQETCQTNVDPAKAAEQLTAAGIPVTLNIVGFTLQGKEKRDAEQLMRPFAEATGGHYYYAENGEALARALSLAALNKFPYEVFDSSGQQVAKGQAGPLSEALQPGEYKVVVHAGDQELTEKVTVTAKADTVLKVSRKGEQFVLEQQQGQAAEPQKAASTGGQ